jgi:CRISPR-associated protein Cst2
MEKFNDIVGNILCDATAAFLNGAGLANGEDQNTVLPKTFKETVNGRKEEVPYVSSQAWRRWLRDTSNEENDWQPSELHAIDVNAKGSTSKISTDLNPIDLPEDDIFGYMKSGSKGEESLQRTSPFKTSILRGIRNMRVLSTDNAFVFPKNGTPLPYSTKFYSTHLEGFFNLEYYRLCSFINTPSRQELSTELIEKYSENLMAENIQKNITRYTLNNAEIIRKERAAGLLRGVSHLRGGAKMAAFGADVSPKVIILAGMSSANPCFNDLYIGKGEKPELNIDLIKELANDYKDKLATPIYIGIRSGYLGNENEVRELSKDGFIIDSPIEIVNRFIDKYLK